MKTIVEVCCGSYEDVMAAVKGGADRVELNSALCVGGLTPSVASLRLVKQNSNIKVITMIRPRGAGFCYSDMEYEVMKAETRLMMENGADGIAFGILKSDGSLDVERCKEIIEIIKEFHGEIVFHRAFDCAANPFEMIEQLIELGVDRILTSGLKEKAFEGKELIKELQFRYGDKIEILAGSGINVANAKELIEYCGIRQIHSSCKGYVEDPTTISNDVSYAYLDNPHEIKYDIVDAGIVKALVDSIR